MYLVKVLLCVIAGIVIGALVAFSMLFFAALGMKFLDWLSEKFDL